MAVLDRFDLITEAAKFAVGGGSVLLTASVLTLGSGERVSTTLLLVGSAALGAGLWVLAGLQSD
jgi:hypothetical protein